MKRYLEGTGGLQVSWPSHHIFDKSTTVLEVVSFSGSLEPKKGKSAPLGHQGF